MKYGKLISMWPSSASRRSTISRSMTWKVSTVISRSCSSRISTKRDMWVPLKWCGRQTYMLNTAMVCCTPPERSWMRIGWRIALMPTLSMASLRESGLAWTSGMLCRSRAFMGLFYHPTKLLGHCRAYRVPDAGRIQPHRGEQLCRVAMVDEAVRQPQKENFPVKSHAGQCFAHRAARAAHHLVLLHGDDEPMAFGQAFHQLDVKRLHETHIRHRRVELFGGLERRPEHRAEGEDRHALSGPSHFPFSQGNGLHFLERRSRGCAARIAHGGWGAEVEARVKHLPAFVGVGGSHHREIGHRAQIGEVEGAVVGRPIAADDAAGGDRKQHRQVLDRDVVDQLVVAALQESRIDAQDRPHALAGEARGKRHRVLLGDADVEVALWKLLRVLHHA